MNVTIRTMNHTLFKGASVHFPSSVNAAERAEILGSLKQVVNVFPQVSYPAITPEIQWVAPSSDIAATAALGLTRRDLGSNNTAHIMTQVDQMHEAGFRGEGIKIAVIDSGVSTL